jgi:serine phosphatase RsbU (regulator of sigma subunit)
VEELESQLIRQTAGTISRLLHGEDVPPVAIPTANCSRSLRDLVEVTNLLVRHFAESKAFLEMLSQGNLNADPPPRNLLLSPFKQLHSNLRHLVWQTHQVSLGDLSQRVDFLGTFSDAFNSMIASLREKRRVEEALRAANATIMEGIQYAQTIQGALLPREADIHRVTRDYCCIWRPRDLIGGDMFAFETVPEGFVVAVMDCTGHGVPGAIMTMIARTCLARAIQEKGYEDPAAVLACLNTLVQQTLNQHRKDTPSDDGLDIGLCCVNKKEEVLTFAGAKISLFFLLDQRVQEVRPDKQSIGYKTSSLDFTYTNHHVEAGRGIPFYMTTDGLTDQIGGPRGFPFGKRRFWTVIAERRDVPMLEQMKALELSFDRWRGVEPQVDDVTCLGFRV